MIDTAEQSLISPHCQLTEIINISHAPPTRKQEISLHKGIVKEKMRLAVVFGILVRCVLGELPGRGELIVTGIQFIEPNASTVWSTEGPNTVSWAYNRYPHHS
jgi:hypothetical protein